MHRAEDPLERLRAIVRGMPPVAVAYSGGVDSSLLLKVAIEEQGDRATAMIASTMLMPSGELDAAVAMARTIGVEPEIVDVDLTRSVEVQGNHADRCYHCKRAIFGAIIGRAQALGFPIVIDGSHAGDRLEDRPGMRALRELGVRSPLAEAGLSKPQIRDAAGALGLRVALRPASPCLATRFPFYDRLNPVGLSQVDRAESLLRDRGFHQVRVRHHGSIARIEVDPQDIDRVVSDREVILAALTGLGFTYVAVDLRGFRTGSMSEALATLRADDED